MKELTIVPPEGYEIDKENSTLEKIVFKEIISDIPRSWNEFCQNSDTLDEYLINNNSEIERLNFSFRRSDYNKNLCINRTDAEAFLALIQLRRLWWEWEDKLGTGDCVFGYWFDKGENEWQIGSDYLELPLKFPDEKNAEEFLKCFKSLFNKVKSLYK